MPGALAADADLDDAVVQQTLDMVPFVRRGGAIQAFDGIFTGTIENDHVGPGATSVTTDIDPYNAGGSAFAPFPAEVSREFDVWILGGSAVVSAGAQSITDGFMALISPVAANGFATGGSQISFLQLLQTFDNVFVFGTGQAFLAKAASLEPSDSGTILATSIPALRVPRGYQIRFSTTAPGVSTYIAQMLIGLFPVGLGQDFRA